jgi:hypothetical protein
MAPECKPDGGELAPPVGGLGARSRLAGLPTYINLLGSCIAIAERVMQAHDAIRD